MKYYSQFFLVMLVFFISCKKDITKSKDEALSSGASEYAQGDTTGYSTGNCTPYQFQTQEIDLVAGPNNTYSANFAGVTLTFSGISHPINWQTGQSAGLFTVYKSGNSEAQLSSSAPYFSVAGYVTTSAKITEHTYTDKDNFTWHFYSYDASMTYLTISGVLIMSQYSSTGFAIMPGGYHPKDPPGPAPVS